MAPRATRTTRKPRQLETRRRREPIPARNAQVAHHRNGISGAPFYVITAEFAVDGSWQPFVAVRFDDVGRCAILQRDLLAKGEIAFGENSWRYEDFSPAIENLIDLEAHSGEDR
jgi:hypothetical protein